MVYWKNMGATERWARALAGAALLAGAYLLFGATTRALLLGGAGAMLALTGAVGFCPACALAGRRRVEDHA
jgi:hypothetical protein